MLYSFFFFFFFFNDTSTTEIYTYLHTLSLHDALPIYAALDCVGDVRDHLDGGAQVVAGALLADHVLVDLAGGDLVLARQPGVDEALVVAEVQVGLGAVVGDVHLAVLERAHRARVDVDVWIELHHRHAQAARLEDGRQGSRGHALAEGGHHAAGDEHERGEGG